jgi:hypothetical protein
VERVFSFLRSDSDKANLDWKQRARTNVERMSQGGLMGLAEVVKGLQVLSELRPLPTKERELYDNARHLLVAELAASLNIAEVDAEDSVDVVLFPPGRERPKRTAEEFRSGSEEDGMELGEDLLELGGEMELGAEEQAEPEEAAAEEAAAPAPKAKAGGKAKPEKKAPSEKKPAARPEKKAPAKAEKKAAAKPEKKAPAKKPAPKPAAKKPAGKAGKKK